MKNGNVGCENQKSAFQNQNLGANSGSGPEISKLRIITII